MCIVCICCIKHKKKPLRVKDEVDFIVYTATLLPKDLYSNVSTLNDKLWKAWLTPFSS